MNALSLGTIVSFNSPKKIDYDILKQGLRSAGLDEALAQEMEPQNAFRRACRQLKKERVIDVVKDEKDEIVFQFTKKVFGKEYVDFNHERDVTVNKKTGRVSTSNYEFEQRAQTLLDEEIAIRHGADITRLVHKIFDMHGGDLIKIRPKGGAYFVPKVHTVLVDAIRILLATIGGELVSYEIGGESETTRESVAKNMFDHIQGMIDEFNESCESLNEETSQDVRERRQAAVNALRVKMDAYKGLLGEFGDQIKASISKAENDMNERLFGAILGDKDESDSETESEPDRGADPEPELEPEEAVAVHDINLDTLFAGIL